MKPYLVLTLLLAALLSFAYALPSSPTDLTVSKLADATALVDPTSSTNDSLTINGTIVFSTGTFARDPAPGVCHLNIGLVEHFPRGGSTGGRQASVFMGFLVDGKSKDIWWRWDNGESGYPNGRTTERRIDNYTIRIYDLIRRGDSLAFTWVHPDDSKPEEEWMDFNFNGNKWSDRSTDCKSGYCCRTGPFYGDGKDRMIRGISCAFRCH